MKKLLIIGSGNVHNYNYIELIKDYFDEILLLTDKKDGEYNITTIEVDFRLGLTMIGSIKKIKSIVKSYSPSVIHIHQSNSYALITLLAMKNNSIPTILTALGSDVLVNPNRNILLKKILSYNLNHVKVATSDSLFMATEMKKYNQNLNVHIANFGIEAVTTAVKKENIIYSNRLHNPLYNIEKVIENFYEFSKKNRDWKLIVGSIGSETKNLKKMVHTLGLEDSVEFIGWVDEDVKNYIYQKAKIFISIPSSDATAISLLEAIAHNCICFVSNLPANSEHILDGINGFIEPNVEKIDLDKYSKIDMELLERVNQIRKESYLKEYNRKKFIDIYEEVLK